MRADVLGRERNEDTLNSHIFNPRTRSAGQIIARGQKHQALITFDDMVKSLEA